MIIGISGRIGSGKDTVGQIIQYLTNEYAYKTFTFEQWFKEPHYSRDVGVWQIKKFADKLKECASIITGITRADFERMDVKNGLISKDWDIVKFKAGNGEYYHFGTVDDIPSYNKHGYDTEKLTVRKFLQRLGTEVGRAIHPNFWVNALFSGYNKIASNWDADGITTVESYPNWIITDVRFPNEADAIKSRGGIMIRMNRNEGVPSDHTSETALDNYIAFDYKINNNGTTIEELVELVRDILKKERIIKD